MTSTFKRGFDEKVPAWNLSAERTFVMLAATARDSDSPPERKLATMKKEKEKGRPMSITSRGRADNGGRSRGDSSVERAIGSRLRAYYDEVAREPVPERFVELLKQLDDDSKKH